jgi:hypothetical protein
MDIKKAEKISLPFLCHLNKKLGIKRSHKKYVTLLIYDMLCANQRSLIFKFTVLLRLPLYQLLLLHHQL